MSPNLTAACAIFTLAEQGGRFRAQLKHHNLEQFLKGDGLDPGAADLHDARDLFEALRNDLKAGGIAGEVWTLHNAFGSESPANELFTPGQFFSIMDGGVDRVIDAQ